MSVLDIPFKDGTELIIYSDDQYCSPGCPTCNYGSCYTNEIRIETTNYNVDIIFENMYEYGFTTADMIRLLAVNLKEMTEEEFLTYLEEEVRKFDCLDRFDKRKVERKYGTHI